MKKITKQIEGCGLSITDFSCLDKKTNWELSHSSRQKIQTSRRIFERLATANKPIYGVTTGFGEMVYVSVDASDEVALQTNLVRSHAAGVGPYFSKKECRAILLSRINALAKGYSAVREELVDRLVFILNSDAVAAIPEIGSLGASGDLAPLSHLALSIIGEGEMYDENGNLVSSRVWHQTKGLIPMNLRFKEGLALINGTSAMTGLGSLVLEASFAQVRQAEIITALALEVLQASIGAFAEEGHLIAKPHQGQIECAANLRRLLDKSGLIMSHEALEKEMLQKRLSGNSVDTGTYLQKAYTLRCIPQILGAVRDNLNHARTVLEIELNSANDNPLFFSEDLIFHGGNFHGQPVAFVMDTVAMVLVQLGVVSERRLNRLLNRHLSNGLPEFLVASNPGLSCGFAGAQYPATALIAENRSLCSPASIQSVPSNGDNQDVVSMGLIAARKARQILHNNWFILAVEALAAAQAVDIMKYSELLSPAGLRTYNWIRSIVAPLMEDRYMRPDIEVVAQGLKDCTLLVHQEKAGLMLS